MYPSLVKRALLVAILGCPVVAACRGSAPATTTPEVLPLSVPDASSDAAISLPVVDSGSPTPPELARICSFYACTAEADRIRLPDGATIVWDDGKTKKTLERIDHPDVEDVFALKYPAGSRIEPVLDPEIDPGRIRLEALFRATYGADAKAVAAAMVPVKIAGHTVSFHEKAAPALTRVAERLTKLLAKDPSLSRYFEKLGGTFNPRNIAGTDHPSAHSWAIAIDIDTSHSDYWRSSPAPRWTNKIPQAIVDVFEAEGFVWGGRWFHYDTMHFEYRPELFPSAP